MLFVGAVLALARFFCRVVGSTMMTIIMMTHRTIITHSSIRSSETLLLLFNEGLFALVMVVLFAYYCWTQVFPYIINVLLPKVVLFLCSVLIIYFIGVLCVRFLSTKKTTTTTTTPAAVNCMIETRDGSPSAATIGGGNDRTSTKKLKSKAAREQIRATAKRKIDAASEAQRTKIELSNANGMQHRPPMRDVSGLAKINKKQEYVKYWRKNASYLGD